jgi:predicted aldo/keto reductase-like oxidoreductase
MQYRTFGTQDWLVSALGFGCARLPIVGDDHSKIDEPEAIRMIRRAIDGGVNYLDTAYNYHGEKSERLVGMALQDGYRERVKLATKLPGWLAKEAGDFDCLNFHLYNHGVMYDDPGYPRFVYNDWLDEGARASACIQCRECEAKCTQQIEISAWMPRVHAVLGEKEPYPESGVS